MDILLAVLVFVLTAGTAYLGVYVTLHPPEDEKKKTQFKRLFVELTVLAAVAIGYQAFHTEEQLNTIQHNTEQPPHVTVNVPGSRPHARVDWFPPTIPQDNAGHPGYRLLPFRTGEVPMFDIGYFNGGDLSMRNPEMRAKIVVVPTKDYVSVFAKYHDKLAGSPPINGGDLNPHNPPSYYTFLGTALASDDAKKLNNGSEALCAIATTNWQDDTGQYETDYSRCFTKESFAPFNAFNWHVNPEDEREHALP